MELKYEFKGVTILEFDNFLNYHEDRSKVPWLKFDQDWEVKIIPSYGGALVRFAIKKNSMEVDIYLDCHDRLGYMGRPYWEVFYRDGSCDVQRFFLEEEKIMFSAIRNKFKNWEKEKNIIPIKRRENLQSLNEKYRRK